MLRNASMISISQQKTQWKDRECSRRATGWILKTKIGEMSYTQRLLALELLPLCYDREIKDLVFFFKALYGYINLNINDYVSFVDHGRTRLSQITSVILQTPLCNTTRLNHRILTV